MNTQFHTPSFGDEIFDLGDASTSTPTSSFASGNQVNQINSRYMYQQRQQTSPSTNRTISLHNTSDEYHTANEESFNVTANASMNNSMVQQNFNNTPSHVLSGGQSTSTVAGTTTMAARKQMVPLDQNEPTKPLSAYALFFRDTVSAIKQQNPTCTFQELSKIVASMWDALNPIHKEVYNKKNELARTEYLKQMRIFHQQQQLRQEQLQTTANETVETEASSQQLQQTSAGQQVTQPVASNNTNIQQNAEAVGYNVANTANNIASTTNSPASGAPSIEQMRLLNEAGSVQKCTRENCNKRAIINPDWEDEYCSNECVVIHCRNVFNDWVQSNLEAKQTTTT